MLSFCLVRHCVQFKGGDRKRRMFCMLSLLLFSGLCLALVYPLPHRTREGSVTFPLPVLFVFIFVLNIFLAPILTHTMLLHVLFFFPHFPMFFFCSWFFCTHTLSLLLLLLLFSTLHTRPWRYWKIGSWCLIINIRSNGTRSWNVMLS